jgi:prepilin-type N-terminal cleavage/methylation domain-containing protein
LAMGARDVEVRMPSPLPGGSRRWGRVRARSRRRDECGLTLVELMIVVTIIAIIAAVAFAIYQDTVKKAKLAADLGIVASLRSAVAIYYGRSNGSFPDSLGAVESLVHPTPVYSCSARPVYDPANGKITFTASVNDCP